MHEIAYLIVVVYDGYHGKDVKLRKSWKGVVSHCAANASTVVKSIEVFGVRLRADAPDTVHLGTARAHGGVDHLVEANKAFRTGRGSGIAGGGP